MVQAFAELRYGVWWYTRAKTVYDLKDVADLTPQQRSRLPADLAAATTHWAIPDVERRHLLITVHHGHLQGGDKCKGDRRWCATCLKAGDQHEDTTTHTAHECTVAREVWAKVANAWEDATGERLDVSHPRLTVLGLRPAPPQGGRAASRPCEGSQPSVRGAGPRVGRAVKGVR